MEWEEFCAWFIGFESARSVKEVRVFAATKYSDMLVMLSMRAVFRSMTSWPAPLGHVLLAWVKSASSSSTKAAAGFVC